MPSAAYYRARLAEGVPAGNLEKANMLTFAGVNGSGARYQRRQAVDEQTAASVVNAMLRQSASNTQSRNQNPYSNIIDADYYGMGDDTSDSSGSDPVAQPVFEGPDISPTTGTYTGPTIVATTPNVASAPSGGSSSAWDTVLGAASKNIFGGIGTGLSRLIGGNAPMVAPPSTGLSSLPLGPILLIGGALAAFLLLRKKSAA